MAGGAIGACLAAYAFPLGVYVATIPDRVMFSVAVSLPCVSCVANLIGAGLPLICEKLGLDPAVIAAPMMTTMVDCSGILTYLWISGIIIGEEETVERLEELVDKVEDELGEAPCHQHESTDVTGEASHGAPSPAPKPARGNEGESPPPPPPPHEGGEELHVPETDLHEEGDDSIRFFMNVVLVVMLFLTAFSIWSQLKHNQEEKDKDSHEHTDVSADSATSSGKPNEAPEAIDEAPIDRIVRKASVEDALRDTLAKLSSPSPASEGEPAVNATEIIRELSKALGVTVMTKNEVHKHMSTLKTVPLLEHLSALELRDTAEALEVHYFKPGEPVIVEGDDTDVSMYIVESGTALCTKEGINDGKPIKEYGVRDFFGERALLADEPRAATIAAESELCVLRLNRAAFERILASENLAVEKIEALQSQYQSVCSTPRANRLRGGAVLGRVGGPSVTDALSGMYSRRPKAPEGPPAGSASLAAFQQAVAGAATAQEDPDPDPELGANGRTGQQQPPPVPPSVLVEAVASAPTTRLKTLPPAGDHHSANNPLAEGRTDPSAPDAGADLPAPGPAVAADTGAPPLSLDFEGDV